jgi:hypothetical protein
MTKISFQGHNQIAFCFTFLEETASNTASGMGHDIVAIRGDQAILFVLND